MRTGYDAIASLSHNIPTDAQIVAGYVSPSHFAWSTADWARFPNSVIVRITPQITHTGLGIHVLDVEKGDATPAQAPLWAKAQRALGQDPTVYCSASAWPTVQAAFTAAKVAQPHYWIAAYPGGGAVLPTLNGIRAVAHQYQSTAKFDKSAVADVWPGVDPPPPTPPEDDMSFDLTSPLPDPASVAGDGTVQEALTAVLNGITGKRSAGVVIGDMAAVLSKLDAQAKQLTAIQGALTKEEADLLAAVNALPTGGQVDVTTLAAALAPLLAPLLPAQTTPEEMGAAVVAALRAQFNEGA